MSQQSKARSAVISTDAKDGHVPCGANREVEFLFFRVDVHRTVLSSLLVCLCASLAE